MPIYEYQCHNCHKVFDALRPFSKADEEISCKSCASEDTSRILSTFFSHAKGATSGSPSASKCGSCSSNSCATCR